MVFIVIFDLANFLIIMIRFSISLTAALSISLAGVAQVNDVETYILNKSKPKGHLPPIVLDTKNLKRDVQDVDRSDGAVAHEINDRVGQIPNSYLDDNCVSMPNVYMGDNCVPMPNAYNDNTKPATIIRRLPDSKTPHLSDSTIQELRKHLPDTAIQKLLKGFKREGEKQDGVVKQPEPK